MPETKFASGKHDQIQYFYCPPSKDAKRRNNKRVWCLAFRAPEWNRSLETRGWNFKTWVTTRRMTVTEAEFCDSLHRYYCGWYESLDKLLEDERETLGADSDVYKRIESELKARVI